MNTPFLYTDSDVSPMKSPRPSEDLVLDTESTLTPYYLGHIPPLIRSIHFMSEIRDLLNAASQHLARNARFCLYRNGVEIPPRLEIEDYNINWLLMLGVQFPFTIGGNQSTLYDMLSHFIEHCCPQQTRLAGQRGFSDLNPQAMLVLLIETMIYELDDRPSLSIFPASIQVFSKHHEYSIVWNCQR